MGGRERGFVSSSRNDLLLIDAGGLQMDVLAARLRRLGYRAIWAKTSMEAYDALGDARYRIGAALIPPDLPTTDLRRALARFREVSGNPDLGFAVAGPRPGLKSRRRLQDAGVAFALWEPLDQHTLRFQVNRALAGADVVLGHRTALRAPADWAARVRSGARVKPARVYTVSASGAYLSTPSPSQRRASLRVELPLPGGRRELAARVVMTNVPGNLLRPNLPVGMGIRFEGAGVDVQAALELYAASRFRALSF